MENIEIDAVVSADDLSEEEIEKIVEELAEEEAEKQTKLDSLGVHLASLRSAAIDARIASGIEDQWREDEEFYAGIDEASKSESNAWKSKPPGRIEASPTGNGSSLFLNITGQYCDSSAASLADMLLTASDIGWSLRPSPLPEMVEMAEGKIRPELEKGIVAATGGDQAAAQDRISSIVAEAAQRLEKARKAAEAAEEQIKDWHIECQYSGENRKVIEDASRIGSGVLKGPIPEKKSYFAYKDGEVVTEEKLIPVSRAISPWSLFPDSGCGQSVHDGNCIFERDYITAKRLKELKGTGYIDSQIDLVLEEGPSEATKTPPKEAGIGENSDDKKNLYEIWYFYGALEKKDMEAAGCECEEDIANAHAVMVNNRVIKATESHLEDGEFPYDVMVWKRRMDSPWGTGIARLIRTPQRVINAAGRNLMDNAGLAGGPMWAYNSGLVNPIDGVAELAPRKGWIANEDADLSDMSKAFTFFKMDMMVGELQSIISLGLKFAEDVTGLPMIMQGQMGASSPDTLGQTQILNNNASTVRRRIARLFDDLVTEPHVRRYYRYLLEHSENEEAKGDFTIEARGSSALVERSIQKQQIMELGRLVLNPVYGIDPKKWAAEYLRSEQFDSRLFEYDDEEWQKIVANMSQPQSNDPRLQIAQMKIELDKYIADQKAQRETDKLLQKDESQNKDNQHELDVLNMEQAFKAELERMRQAGVKDNILDESKVRINETVMRLTTQKELAAVGNGVKQVARDGVEPVGRANNGKAFQQ